MVFYRFFIIVLYFLFSSICFADVDVNDVEDDEASLSRHCDFFLRDLSGFSRELYLNNSKVEALSFSVLNVESKLEEVLSNSSNNVFDINNKILANNRLWEEKFKTIQVGIDASWALFGLEVAIAALLVVFGGYSMYSSIKGLQHAERELKHQTLELRQKREEFENNIKSINRELQYKADSEFEIFRRRLRLKEIADYLKSGDSAVSYSKEVYSIVREFGLNPRFDYLNILNDLSVYDFGDDVNEVVKETIQKIKDSNKNV